MKQNITTLHNRVNELGRRADHPAAGRKTDCGSCWVQDTAKAKDILGRTASVAGSATGRRRCDLQDGLAVQCADGYELLEEPVRVMVWSQKILREKDVELTGDNINDALPV